MSVSMYTHTRGIPQSGVISKVPSDKDAPDTDLHYCVCVCVSESCHTAVFSADPH